MARILNIKDTSWYDELRAVSYYSETHLEDTIRQHLEHLFPDFLVFPFKRDVQSQTTLTIKRPDLAMIRKDLKAWGVIEVELSDHNVSHVIEQTTVFIDGSYNAPEVARYVQKQIETHCQKSLSLSKIENLLSSERPAVLVIVDAHTDEWRKKLEKLGVGVCIFEAYKNTKGSYIYRTSGNYPVVPAQEAHCRAHASISNMLEINGSISFRKLGTNNEISIIFDDKLTRWVVLEDKGKTYLKFVGKLNPLYPNVDYALFVDRRNRYYFRKN